MSRGKFLQARYPRLAAPLRAVASRLNDFAETWGLLDETRRPAKAGNFTVNHVGLVVPNIEEFLAANDVRYKAFQRTVPVVNERQRVREAFITDGSTVIELLEPMGEGSPLRSFLNKNSGGGLVHICFECDDIKEGMQSVTRAGGLAISGPTPDIAFGERPVAFMMLANQVIELVQRESAARGSAS
jgi:methylmalonyl-CoA/ethylmalonyl-CoA epimerase